MRIWPNAALVSGFGLAGAVTPGRVDRLETDEHLLVQGMSPPATAHRIRNSGFDSRGTFIDMHAIRHHECPRSAA